MILVKFFLHISDEEQLKRFKAREKDPLKSWKLTDEDWRNRARRRDYEAAIEEMVERTSTTTRPGPRRGREQALRAGEGDRDRVTRSRRDLALCGAPCAPASARGSSARLGLRLLLVLVRTLVAQARAGELGLRDRAARASRMMNQPITPKPMISAPPMMNRTLRPVSPSSLVGASTVGGGRRLGRRERAERRPTAHPPERRGRGRAEW